MSVIIEHMFQNLKDLREDWRDKRATFKDISREGREDFRGQGVESCVWFEVFRLSKSIRLSAIFFRRLSWLVYRYVRLFCLEARFMLFAIVWSFVEVEQYLRESITEIDQYAVVRANWRAAMKAAQ